MNTYEINGTYGSSQTPCTILVYEESNGDKWHCVKGSCNVNLTYDDIEDGVDVEDLSVLFTHRWSNGIETLNELKTIIEL